MERSFPNLNGDTLFVKIRRELELYRSFEAHRLKEKRSLFRSICGRGPASRKESRWESACTRTAHRGGPRILDPAAHLAPYIGLSHVERSGSRDFSRGLSRNFHFQSFRFARARAPRPLFPRHRAVQDLSFAPNFEPRKSELPSPRSKPMKIAQTAARQHAVLPTLRCLFALIAVILKKLKRTSCSALSSKYHTLSPVMTSALARRSRESKSEKLNASMCSTRQKRVLRWAEKGYSLEEKNITNAWQTGTSTNRATAVNVNRLWERRRTGRELRDSVDVGRCVLLGIHCMHSLATGSRRPRCMWRNLAGRHFLTGASEPLWRSSIPSVSSHFLLLW